MSSTHQHLVLRGPGSDEMVVVDPGPEDDEHIAKVAELARSRWC